MRRVDREHKVRGDSCLAKPVRQFLVPLIAEETGAVTTFGDIPAFRRRTGAVLIAALAAAACVAAAKAQPQAQPQPAHRQAQQPQQPQPSGPPNALQGFSQNRDKPVKINAAELEVHDKDKTAVFSGDVHLVQGDTSMRTSTLVVYYDDQPPPPAPAPPQSSRSASASAQITPQQNQQIKKVEAKGSVMVTQKDQTATADLGTFDMRANTVTMSGNVVITRGPNVMKGDRLTVNMTSGDSKMECEGSRGALPCKVQLLIIPDSLKGQQGLPGPGRKP
jgi:lipopolysaccharide export system protein LptA